MLAQVLDIQKVWHGTPIDLHVENESICIDQPEAHPVKARSVRIERRNIIVIELSQYTFYATIIRVIQ
jgi:hypothetical protein